MVFGDNIITTKYNDIINITINILTIITNYDINYILINVNNLLNLNII